MCVSVLGVTTSFDGVGRVRQVEEDQPTEATAIPRTSSDGDTIFKFFVHNHVVGSPQGQVGEMARQILLVREFDGSVGSGDVEKLGHVKDLNTMALELATNENVVLEGSNFLPPRVIICRGERRTVKESAKVE